MDMKNERIATPTIQVLERSFALLDAGRDGADRLTYAQLIPSAPICEIVSGGSALPKDGGNGAVMVLLKKQQPPKSAEEKR